MSIGLVGSLFDVSKRRTLAKGAIFRRWSQSLQPTIQHWNLGRQNEAQDDLSRTYQIMSVSKQLFAFAAISRSSFDYET